MELELVPNKRLFSLKCLPSGMGTLEFICPLFQMGNDTYITQAINLDLKHEKQKGIWLFPLDRPF